MFRDTSSIGPTCLEFAANSSQVVDLSATTVVVHAMPGSHWATSARRARRSSRAASRRDWSRDEFSRETWRVFRPGQLTRDAAEYRRAEGNLSLAAADVAAGAWNGFVDGAIESGLSAAREAVFAVTRPGGDPWP
jgi:hypothetical protein